MDFSNCNTAGKTELNCRVCNNKTKQTGLLYRCMSKSCGAAHWDESAIKRLAEENENTSTDALPDWLTSLLREAKVPEFKRGEYYAYIIKLLTNLPEDISARRRARIPNNGNGRFYVGMTGLHPYQRYVNHVRGYKASWAAKNMAISMITFEGPMSHEEAVKREPELAQELRERGFDVHSN